MTRAPALTHTLDAVDPTGARATRIRLAHGEVQTPMFMPVGTAGTVKGVTPDQLVALGAQVCLGNTYHLYLRPGADIVQAHGGLHRFMGYPGPLLTDSGGFQVYSLEGLRRIDEDGVTFQSHIDGSKHRFTPESVVDVQQALGADIAMAFDECPPARAARDDVARSMERTSRWERRCLSHRSRPDQALFGIVQGGLHEDLRAAHAEELAALTIDGAGFEGMAIGGLSVGESTEELHAMTAYTAPLLPADRPRYLMGVGTPEDLLAAIAAGVDMFDCVMPTRNARNGRIMTAEGDFSIRNARFREDQAPLSASCSCPTCRTFTRAYLRHLAVAKEMLFGTLATLHNLHYYLDLVRRARAAIVEGRFGPFADAERARRQELSEADEAAGSRG